MTADPGREPASHPCPDRDPVPTYPEVCGTRREELPAGYHHLRHQVLIGQGREVFETAGAAVTTWRMHRAAGVRIRAGALRAEPGGAVTCAIGIGPFRIKAPCRVVWTVYEPRRIGFAYGTLAGHPECGEESFVVELLADDSVRFTVTAFSRPSAWYARLAGPLTTLCQRLYARHCGRTLRRLAAVPPVDADSTTTPGG